MSTSNALLWFSTVFAIVVVLEPLKDVRGSSDLIEKFPYSVGLASGGRGTVNETVCSGTLVAATFVLTSAFADRENQGFQLKRPFRHVRRFVKLSSETFDRDEDMDCVVVGIGATDERLYKVPVKAKYGLSACEIPKSNPIPKYILGFTWTDFACTRTVGAPPTRRPCGRADPLLCDRDRLYGMSSYGYGVYGAGSGEPADCGDPTVQGRSAFVNEHRTWIADTMLADPTCPPDEDRYPYLANLQGRADELTCGGTPVANPCKLYPLSP